MPVERVMGPSRNSIENHRDLQAIARNMRPTLWAPSENISFGLLYNRGLRIQNRNLGAHLMKALLDVTLTAG